MLRKEAKNAPDNTAVFIDLGNTITYGEWEAFSNKVARKLVKKGVKQDDRIGLLYTNNDVIYFLISYMAIHKAGAVAVPLNPRFKPLELSYQLEHAEIKHLFCVASSSLK